ncbi:PrgI family protein [Catellatospora chokoriensis]|uniref:PrgI family protein n=1 Tax=Catellatospora chokoriensis TaxID=310353 RepID=A0A8J3K3T3_9ACTN|nr:PrgI family protein [Catellatospora chokoriensis]GIF89808.1 hypothetical protein Cch02nite_32520 [Catellatospora chokoriensis]
MNTPDDIPRARVSADVDQPDRIAFGLTFRQLAIIGSVGFTGWAVYRSAEYLLPLPVWLCAALLVGAVTIVVALGRRDGLPLDVWLRNAITLSRSPRTLAPGQPSSATSTTTTKPVVPAPLRPALTSLTASGVLTTSGSARLMLACGTANIHLRTSAEQAALLEGFGRMLNALTGPAQIVVAAHRHDLTPYAQAVVDAAPRLPHPALQAAADDYAAYLLELDDTRDPLRRQVLTVVTGEHSGEATSRALGGIGLAATVLDGPAVAAALAAAVDPFEPPVPGPRAVPGIPVTLRSNR